MHPDVIAEAVRWSICEAGLIQVIGRGRAVNRTEEDPLQVDVISTMPLPLEVDEVLAKDAIEPNPFTVMAARGVVIDEKATKGKWQVVQKVLPDLFDSDDAARMALKRTNANKIYLLANVRLSGFVHALIKLENARYAVPVWIDANRDKPREVAEKLVGPLTAFEILPVEAAQSSAGAEGTELNVAPVVYLEPPVQSK